MSRKSAIPIVVATLITAPALSAIALQAINGSLRLPVITVSLAVIAAATWTTYITGRRAERLTKRVDRLEATLRVESLTLDTGNFRRPLRRVD